jgi:hypothetical protein
MKYKRKKKCIQILVGKCKRKRRLVILGVDERIILKLIFAESRCEVGY